MTDDDHDDKSGYTAALESRADHEQQQAEEQRRATECAKHGKPLLPVAYAGGWFNTLCQQCVDDYERIAMTKTGHTYEYHGPHLMGADGKLYRETRLK